MPDSKYSVPPGWEKGEPLEINKIGNDIYVEPMYTVGGLVFSDYSNFIGFIKWWFK